MGAAMSGGQLDEKLRCWTGVQRLGAQRLGIQQGVDTEGLPKYQRIDNHLTSKTNDAAERRQKIPMSNTSIIMLLTRLLPLELQSHELED